MGFLVGFFCSVLFGFLISAVTFEILVCMC